MHQDEQRPRPLLPDQANVQITESLLSHEWQADRVEGGAARLTSPGSGRMHHTPLAVWGYTGTAG